MTPSDRNHKKEAAVPVVQEAQGTFWDGANGLGNDVIAYRQKMSEQIARLQQRQMSIVQETASELEALRAELENNKAFEEKMRSAQQPLLNQIAILNRTVGSLEEEKMALSQQLSAMEQQYQQQYNQMQATLDSLKNIIRSQANSFDQQVRVFSNGSAQTVDSMLRSIDEVILPAVPERTYNPATSFSEQAVASTVPSMTLVLEPAFQPITAPVSQPATLNTLEEELKKEQLALKAAAKQQRRAERAPKLFALRTFAVRSMAVALVAGGGWFGWQTLAPRLNTTNTSTTQQGEVAGANSEVPADGLPEYKESFADVPFAQTVWDKTTDPDFGLSFDYPKNATNRVRVIGGSNLWVLRKNGYLLKISRLDSTQTLDAWWAASQSLYLDDATAVKGSFKSLPAYVVTQTEKTSTSGTSYFVKRSTGIYVFWVKDEDPTSDDGQRLTRMLDTLQFSTN